MVMQIVIRCVIKCWFYLIIILLAHEFGILSTSHLVVAVILPYEYKYISYRKYKDYVYRKMLVQEYLKK